MSRKSAARAEPFVVSIDSLSHEGRGVGRVAGKTVFVDNALPGETVRARYSRRHGRYDEAVALEILRSSPARVAPLCPHFGTCGGCRLQHLAPEDQLQHKQRVLLEQLEHIGKVRPQEVMAAVTGPAWGYRRRARLGVRMVPKKGGALVGFREKHGRYIADIHTCAVLDPAVGEKLATLREMIAALSCADQVPQIEVAVDANGPVLTLRLLQPLSDADRETVQRTASANGWRIYLQPGGTDSVVALAGDDAPLYFDIPRHDIRLQFEPLDFIQVNGAINVAAIDRVLALLEPGPADAVLDLFCGLGNFTLPLARCAGSVTGVEGDASLVARAWANARANNITNVSFVQCDLMAGAPGVSGFNKLMLDPPRTGALAVLQTMQLAGVERVVYVSCNPATLARDAGVLVRECGYTLKSAGVMDMFPHTAHVETLALFAR